MSYMSTGIGPSPFLITSRHHYHHHQPLKPSTHPHYHINSYTNHTSYLDTIGSVLIQEEPKYFRSDLRNVFPQMSRLQTQDNEKILNPLNTYSGNVFNTSKISSPFDRGEIYYGNKNPKISATSQSSVTTIIDNLESSFYRNKKQNPFNKKYLLSEKNMQLENYAFYSSIDASSISVSQPMAPRKKLTNKPRKFSNQLISDQQDIPSQVHRLATRYDRIQQQQQHSPYQHRSKTQYNSTGHLNVYTNRQTFQPPRLDNNYRSQRQYDELVESVVDEKQFDSFGQGKEHSGKREKGNARDSIILGLEKMENSKPEGEDDLLHEKLRREPVFIESEDDERRSGSFKVPEAIIDEINNPRIPTTILKRSKQSPYGLSIQKSIQITQRGEKPKITTKKSQQHGPPPNMIMLRGKTYEKLTL